MPGARWYPEARLNIAENLMRRGDRGDALVLWDENGPSRRLSYADLTSDVSRAAQALQALGLRAGDRVAAFIPNIPEAAMLALAALSQGIVWASCSPDFGVDGVLERFGQIEPKVLFCADGYRYGGRDFDVLERVKEIAEGLPTCAGGGGAAPELRRMFRRSKAVLLDMAAQAHAGRHQFRQLPLSTRPTFCSARAHRHAKCIVHGAAARFAIAQVAQAAVRPAAATASTSAPPTGYPEHPPTRWRRKPR
jgi:acetoacetyl-CoA synthetase